MSDKHSHGDHGKHSKADPHSTLPLDIAMPDQAHAPDDDDPLLEIGTLTIGKPTLSMALSSLLLQD